jgi:hypothetical protein
MDDLLAGLADREAALASFELRASIRGGTLQGRRGGVGGTIVPIKDECVVVADATGRCRFEVTGHTVNTNDLTKLIPLKRRATFDGSRAVVLEGRPDKTDWQFARISANAHDAWWGKSVRELLTHYNSQSIRQVLVEKKATIIGACRWQGVDGVTVETAVFDGGKGSWKQQFDILPDRGFLVVRSASLVKFTPEQEWKEYTHILCEAAVEDSSGAWVPARSVYESFELTPTKPPVVTTESSWRYEYTNEWDFSPETDDSTFAGEIPAGAFVNDMITGQSYQSAAVTDQVIADQVLAAEGLQDIARGEGGGRWVWPLVGVCAVVVLLTVFTRRLRRR